MTYRYASIFSTLLLTLAGCGSSHSSEDDASVRVDGSVDSGGIDGGTLDAGSDTGGPVDAGSDAVTLPDTGGGTDAGGGTDGGGIDAGGTTRGIDCLGTTCDETTQQCCVSGGFGGATGMCIGSGETCMGGTIDCDGPEDCGSGEVCCGTGGLGGVTVACVPAADSCGGGGGFTEFELCHDPSDCTDSSSMCCPLDRLGISSGACRATCGFGLP